MRLSGLAIARNVIYRSRTGNYDLPAIITATVDTLNPEGVKRFEETGGSDGVPPLSSPDHVHLTVLTPGVSSEEPPAPLDRNQGGTYREWDVPYSEDAGVPGAEHKAGTWRFPERV